ncbi:probable leucine-rich repeat receptor-like protein kinase At1g35710 [Fagus crenata]
MQIQVLYPEELTVPPTKSPQVEIKETWFLWQELGIGYSIGFSLMVGSIYLNGYFVRAPLPNRRGQQRINGGLIRDTYANHLAALGRVKAKDYVLLDTSTVSITSTVDFDLSDEVCFSLLPMDR